MALSVGGRTHQVPAQMTVFSAVPGAVEPLEEEEEVVVEGPGQVLVLASQMLAVDQTHLFLQQSVTILTHHQTIVPTKASYRQDSMPE